MVPNFFRAHFLSIYSVVNVVMEYGPKDVWLEISTKVRKDFHITSVNSSIWRKDWISSLIIGSHPSFLCVHYCLEYIGGKASMDLGGALNPTGIPKGTCCYQCQAKRCFRNVGRDSHGE